MFRSIFFTGGCDSIKRPTKSGCQVIDGRCVCTAEPGVIVEDISCQYPDVTYKYDPSKYTRLSLIILVLLEIYYM